MGHVVWGGRGTGAAVRYDILILHFLPLLGVKRSDGLPPPQRKGLATQCTPIFPPPHLPPHPLPNTPLPPTHPKEVNKLTPHPATPNPYHPTTPLNDDTNLLLAAHHASHLTDLSPSFFTPLLRTISDHLSQLITHPLDEELAVRHHQQYFPRPTASPSPAEAATARGLGDAAALQALRMFRLPTYDAGQRRMTAGRNAFVGLAMAQAVRLWEEQRGEGNVGGGVEVEGVVRKAGEVAVWLWERRGEGRGRGGGRGWEGEKRGEDMV